MGDQSLGCQAETLGSPLEALHLEGVGVWSDWGPGIWLGSREPASLGVWGLAGFLRNWIPSVPARREFPWKPSFGCIEVR